MVATLIGSGSVSQIMANDPGDRQRRAGVKISWTINRDNKVYYVDGATDEDSFIGGTA